MEALVPTSILKNKGVIRDTISSESLAGNSVELFYQTEDPLETKIERSVFGSSWEKGIVYSVEFESCRENWMTKVHVKEINVTFYVPGGSSVSKCCGERIYHQQNYTEEFKLSPKEICSLLSKNRKKEKLIEVELEVILKNIPGNRHLRSPSYNFYEKNSDSSLAVRFADGKTIYACLPLLGVYSSYFKDLAQKELQKDKNSGLPLLELKEFQSEPFEKLLYVIYPSADPFAQPTRTVTTVSEELRLARFLSLEIAFVRYEKWLSEDHNNFCGTPMEKIIWSLEYVMPILQNQVIQQLWNFSQFDEIQKHPKYLDLPVEVVRLVVKRLLEIGKERDDEESRSVSCDGSTA